MTARFSITLLGGVSVLAMAGSAFAQQTQAAPQSAEATQQVVVTGSRIARYGYSAPTPVTVAPTAELAITTPSSISDGLNKLPQFAGSSTSAGGTNAIGGSGGGTPSVFGGSFLNLRDLGAIRTLVLVDGRRAPPTTLNGQVDSNSIPQMLVQRVDIVTGGASAVYGSDAVAGVVNFVLDTKFSGLKAQAQVGQSSRGDARSNRFGVAGGGNLGKGHFVWSAEHQENAGVLDKTSRPWAGNTPVYAGAGTVASPFTLVNNARLSTSSLGGLATTGPFANQQFLQNGSLGAFNKGTATTSNGIATGGDGAYYTGVGLTVPISTDQAFARFDYDLTDKISAFVQVGGAQNKVWNSHQSNSPPTPVNIYNGNAFLTPAEQTALGATPSFTFARLTRDLAALSNLNQLTTSTNITAGIKGTVFKDFTWDAYYTHGANVLRSQIQNNINLPRYYAALDAVNSGGSVVCRVAVTNPGLYPGCAPLNMFGAGNQSAAALGYVFGTSQWQAVTLVDDAAFSLTGSPFSLWAGPVSTAFSVEYRSQSLTEASNANPLTVPDFTGIRVATPLPTTVWAYSTQGPQHGANNVWEGSAEVDVPLLKDTFLAKALNVNGAVRYTNYSAIGSVVTWKIGVNYQPIQDVRFRITQSHDIRAPTLSDLYAGTTIANISVNDSVHSGQSVIVPSIGGGNPKLVPEVANTTTAGMVYSPSWAPRFKLSVDYYNITMDNAIGSINGSQTAVLAQCEASGGTSPVCATIIRAQPFSVRTGNPPIAVTNLSQNIGQLYTHGVEVEAGYNFRPAEYISAIPGRIDVRALYGYQPVLNTVAYPGAQVTALAGVAGMSSSRVTTFIDYRVGPASISWAVRYLSGQKRSGSPLQIFADPDMPAIYYHDINLTYRFSAASHDGQVFFVVNNLFDQQPRVAPSTNFTASPGTGSPQVISDDPVGRYFTVGLRVQY